VEQRERLVPSPAVVLLLAVFLLTACGSVGAVPTPLPTVPPTPTPALAVSVPHHVTLPLDESPHGDLTGWWYYTGHLAAADGRRYGFELVFFQSRHGDAPPGYEAHFAITDDRRNTFQYDERNGSGEQGGKGPGFNLALDTWHMQGSQGHDALQAQLADYAINLRLSADKPAVLHSGTGLIDFGPFGTSYYYSRTRMAIIGTLEDHGQPVPVTGLAWMDHQWGNFIVGSVGGWDWYAIQLADDSDIMLSFNRGADNKQYFSYGSYVSASGQVTDLSNGSFSQQATGSWTSPTTGVVYPSGWKVAIPSQQLSLTLEPTVKDQELAFGGKTTLTFLNYWEGEVGISGTRGGVPIAGQGYVELTGYGAPK
jgi:predicted secreted hydrolase